MLNNRTGNNIPSVIFIGGKYIGSADELGQYFK